MEKRTEIKASVSVAKCNYEGKHSLEVNVKKSCREEQGGGSYTETDVMVERVSSTTEYSPQRVPEKLQKAAKYVVPGKMLGVNAMVKKHRKKEKDRHSRTLKTDEPRSRSCESRQHSSGGREKRIKSEYKGAQSTFKRDMASQLHTSTKKHLPREATRGELDMSSSLLASTPSRHSLPALPRIRSEPSNSFGRRSKTSSSNLVSHKRHKRTAAENDNQDKGNQMYSREYEDTDTMQKSHKDHDNAPRHDEDGEDSRYEKIVEMKLKEIRNNLMKMSEVPRTLVGSESGDVNLEARHQKHKIHNKDHGEQDTQHVALFPSSLCCSPPPHPILVTKYWSDADETEDESDVEKHMMHVNSVNIVLKFLKNNSDKYYREGRETGTQNQGGENMQAKCHIKERPSHHPHSNLQKSRSKPVHVKKHSLPDRRDAHSKFPGKQSCADYSMLERWSPPRRDHGHSSRSCSPFLGGQSSVMGMPSSQKDQWSRSLSRHRECYDKSRSLRSPPYPRERHNRPCSRSSPRPREHRSKSRSHSFSYHRGHHSRLDLRSSPYQREHHSRSRSHSSSRNREHHHSSSPYHREHHSRSGSPQGHQECTLRRRDSLSPRWHGDHRNRGSNSPQRDRSFPRNRGSHSPRNTGITLRESHPASGYTEDFHRNDQSDSPSRHKEGPLKNRRLHERGVLREEETFPPMNKGFSPSGSRSHSSSHHREHHHSRSRSPQDHQEHSLRHKGLPSSYCGEGYRNRWSHSPQRERSFPRERGPHSPRNTGVALRESHSASGYREGFHRDDESDSPSRHKEGPLRNRQLHEGEGETFPLMNKGFLSGSRRSPQRSTECYAHYNPKEAVPHGTEPIHRIEEFHFPPLNFKKEPLQDYEKQGFPPLNFKKEPLQDYEKQGFPPLNFKKEPLQNYENQGFQSPPDLHQPHAQLWEQHCNQGLTQQDHSQSPESRRQLRGKDSPLMNIYEHGSHSLPQFLSPSHSEQEIPSLPRHLHEYESPQFSRSPRRSVELSADAMGQLDRQETDSRLSLQFDMEAKMASNSSGPLECERKFMFHNYNNYGIQQKKRKEKNVFRNSDHFLNPAAEDGDEYQKGYGTDSVKDYGQRGKRYFTQGNSLGISSGKETYCSALVNQRGMTALCDFSDTPEPIHLKEVSGRDSESNNQGNFRLNTQGKVIAVDDEPTIDQPEEYLKVSSSVSTYHRLSFVPDINDRQKLAGFIDTSESVKTQETLSLPGPSGITSKNFNKGKGRDDHLYWPSNPAQDLEELKCCLPQVGSPHTAPQEVGIYDGAISNTVSTGALSSAQDVAIEAARIEREKAFLTLNSAEMSTLLALIELAKEHIATEDEVPTNVPEMLENTGHENMNSRNISSSLGDQSGSDKEQRSSVYQVSGVLQDKTVNAENSSTSIFSDSTRSNRNNENRQSGGKNIALSTNRMTIPVNKGKKDDKISSTTADSLSKPPNNNRSSQCKSRPQGDNVSVKLPVTCMQSKKKKTNDITLQEQDKDTEQSSKDKCDVKRTHSKKNISCKDQGDRQSNSSKAKCSTVERTFAEMQHVTVCVGDPSACKKIVAQNRRKLYKVERTTTLKSSKEKPLKQVGKRLFVRDSSDSSDDGSEFPEAKKVKDASPVAGSSSRVMHPLHQETIVLDYYVNTCLACKHNLVPDEYTSISLNTGTITMRCRICHTYTRMEKVMSLDSFAKMSIPKKVVSQTKTTCSIASKSSNTSRASINDDNRVNKDDNIIASLRQTEDASMTGRPLGLNKKTRKEKYSSKVIKNTMNERKIVTSAYEKGLQKMLMSVGNENAQRKKSVSKTSKEYKNIKNRKESERGSHANEDTDSKISCDEQESQSGFNSIDPSLCVFPWSSGRKGKKVYENLNFNDSSDEDEV